MGTQSRDDDGPDATAHGNATPATPWREADTLADQVTQNVESVVAIHQREQERLTRFERRLERISAVISRPAYLITVIALVVLWIVTNTTAIHLGSRPFDPPPFEILQGLLTLGSLLTTTVVVIAQRRQARLESRRAHLDLQVNLLTEQKVTKVIHLLEELRRDLPMVRDRFDPEADALQRRADTKEVLSALDEGGVGSDGDRGGRP